MRKVFVSGCYDILHGGHVEFFRQARAMGDYLIVCFAGEKALQSHKGRKSALPIEHKLRLLEALEMVDEVCIGEDENALGLNFASHFRRTRPSFLVVTEDDKYAGPKRAVCAEVGAEYIVLPKTLDYDKTSTTDILSYIKAPTNCPLRVDFAGGWLDVPRLARPGAFIINCAITPGVSLWEWPYELGGGLGGSAAWALMQGRDPLQAELDLDVGWQDPAVIRETGLCVWRSGATPVLDFKVSGEFLRGRMALLWTGKPHTTYALTDIPRNYYQIEEAGRVARKAVLPGHENLDVLSWAMRLSYQVQIDEGMAPLPEHGELTRKYCGGGHGGYALYLFENENKRTKFLEMDGTLAIEPFIR